VRDSWAGFWSALLFKRRVADETNLPLVRAFPSGIQEDVKAVLACLPRDPHSLRIGSYSVNVRGETLSIPYRVYHDISKIRIRPLSRFQVEILNCILSRHADGFVRQRSLEQILGSNHTWVPAFVIQLVGEYVVEILELIDRNLDSFDPEIYSEFVTYNPKFIELTAQRIESYWDCYYRRRTNRAEYVGFRILRYLQNLPNKKTHQID
jgi:hypothetical protein